LTPCRPKPALSSNSAGTVAADKKNNMNIENDKAFLTGLITQMESEIRRIEVILEVLSFEQEAAESWLALFVEMLNELNGESL
jgi:hypothetical protein